METISASAAPELVTLISNCRSCGSGNLREVLDLGTHAVSDFYSEVPAYELCAPLCLVQCERCHLVQLTHSVSRDRLYSDYWYHSGTNPTMVVALEELVKDVSSRIGLETGDTVLDIGANDGTLLSKYPDTLRRVGIDPSSVVGDLSWWTEGDVWCRSFYPSKASWLLDNERPFKAITSIAMFYDLDDPSSFIAEIKKDLHSEGIWVNQMMDLAAMMRVNAFDNICHEHVGYWNAAQFDNVCWEHGLFVSENHRNSTNGGSLRSFVRHLKQERRYPFKEDRFDLDFPRRVAQQKAACLSFLAKCRAAHKVVLGYGASTKGNTLLQYYGIDADLLPAIADRNPDKYGKLTAGSHIPVISEEEMRELEPDYLLILPWHFLDNFLEREAALRATGTRFIVPLPEFRIV